MSSVPSVEASETTMSWSRSPRVVERQRVLDLLGDDGGLVVGGDDERDGGGLLALLEVPVQGGRDQREQKRVAKVGLGECAEADPEQGVAGHGIPMGAPPGAAARSRRGCQAEMEKRNRRKGSIERAAAGAVRLARSWWRQRVLMSQSTLLPRRGIGAARPP